MIRVSRVWALSLVCVVAAELNAQNPTKLTDTIQLNALDIYGETEFNGIKRMGDTDGPLIIAGKKNEVIEVGKTDANTAVNNTRQTFAKVPGLMIWESDGTGLQAGIATRGLSPNRSWEFNTRQNGYDISADPLGYPEAYYTPAFEFAESVQFIRGAASLQFGPQFGGLVNYVFKKPDSTAIGLETYQTAGSYGLFNSFTKLSGTKGKFGYIGMFNHRNADGWRQNSRYNVNNGYAALYYRPVTNLLIKAEYTQMGYLAQQAGGLTDSLFAIDARAAFRSRNWFNIKWRMPALEVNYTINPNLLLNVKAYALFGERNSIGFTSNVGTATGQLNADPIGNRQVDSDEYTNYGAEARVLYTYKLLGANHSLGGGVRYFNGTTNRLRYIGSNGYDADFSNIFPDSLQRNFQFKTTNAAVFVENMFKIGKRLSLVPGMRFEYLNNTADLTRPIIANTAAARNFVLFGIGAGLKTTATTDVYANFSQAYRPVLFSDITPAATSDVIDADLKDARGFNADLGWRGHVANWLNFDASVFYLQYNNRVGRVTVTNGSSTYQLVTNLSNSRTIGGEFYVEINPVKLIKRNAQWGLSVFASGTIQDARYTKGLINGGTATEVDMKDKKVEYAPNNIIRAGLTGTYKTFSATLQVSHTGQVFADANNTESSLTGNTGIVPAYTVADFSAGVTIKKYYVLKGGVNNLFNTKYFTRRSGGYPGPGILPADGTTFYLTVGAKF